MPEFKLTINDVKTGKSYQKTVSGTETDIFKRSKIGNKIPGDSFGLKGYELEIRGGSDNAGFPMRFNLNTAGRKRILLRRAPCVKIKRKGMKKRKTVVGNMLSHTISQINLKITKYGTKSIEEILGKKEASEEKKEEPKQEVKEEKK